MGQISLLFLGNLFWGSNKTAILPLTQFKKFTMNAFSKQIWSSPTDIETLRAYGNAYTELQQEMQLKTQSIRWKISQLLSLSQAKSDRLELQLWSELHKALDCYNASEETKKVTKLQMIIRIALITQYIWFNDHSAKIQCFKILQAFREKRGATHDTNIMASIEFLSAQEIACLYTISSLNPLQYSLDDQLQHWEPEEYDENTESPKDTELQES
jgi:hypothetical protein